MKTIVACTLWVMLYTSAAAQNDVVGKLISHLHLRAIDSSSFNTSQFQKKLVAFVFLSPECPLCKNYSLVLNNLQGNYKNQLDIAGVFAGTSYMLNDIVLFKEKYKVNFTLLTDRNKELVKLLKAHITPEIFLLDKQRRLVYSGAIDDWAVSLGKQRTKSTQNFFENAVVASLTNTVVSPVKTSAVGCFINDL